MKMMKRCDVLSKNPIELHPIENNGVNIELKQWSEWPLQYAKHTRGIFLILCVTCPHFCSINLHFIWSSGHLLVFSGVDGVIIWISMISGKGSM